MSLRVPFITGRHVRASKMLGLAPAWSIAIFLVSVLAGLMEAIGLALLVPVFEFIKADGEVEELAQEGYWRILLRLFSAFDMEVTLSALLALSLALIVARQITVYVRTMMIATVQERITRQTRASCFDGFIHARQELHDQFTLGQFVNSLSIELGLATSALLSPTRALAFGAVGMVYAATLLVVSPVLSALAVAVLGLSMLMMQGLMKGVQRRGKLRLQASEAWTSKVLARLEASRLIRTSGTSASEALKVEVVTRQLEGASLSAFRWRAAIDLLIEPTIFLTALILIYVGIVFLGLSIEAIGLFMIILLRLAPTARAILAERQIVRGNAASLDAIVSLLERLSRAREVPASAAGLPIPERDLRLQGVSFGHNQERGQAVENIDLTLPIGQMTALAGPSGAGKTTLFEILSGLRQPDTGRILFDGVDITERPLAERRQLFTLVPQTAQVLETTPDAHIRYGNPDLSQAELVAAARAAGALDFIQQLPNGFETDLGERGGQLSGGQRQRLDLARALAQTAPILVLDEPTSQLDSESEQIFLETLERVRKSARRTILLIGHRLSTVAVADQIIVMNCGRIVESGTHERLRQAGRWYAEAWRRQTGESACKSAATMQQ